MPCGTLLLPSPTSCGWAAACSPWSCDTASRPCCQVLRLPPLRLQCNHLRHHHWPHPRCSGSRGGAGGGYLDGGCSLLDSRWPRHIESQPAPSTPGGWLTLSQRLLWCCHLKHDQRLLPTLLFAVTNIYGEMPQIMSDLALCVGLAQEKFRITMVLPKSGPVLSECLALFWFGSIICISLDRIVFYKCNLRVNLWFCYTVTICKHPTSTQRFPESLSDKHDFKLPQSHERMKNLHVFWFEYFAHLQIFLMWPMYWLLTNVSSKI